MLIPFRLSCTLFTASLLLAATANIVSLNTPAKDPIAALHLCIEQRFQARTSFGMSRVLPDRSHGILRFEPENATEQKVVTELQNQGYQVALFLVGRYALDAPSGQGDLSRFGLQGPAFMTAEPKDLPDSAELLSTGRKALLAFASSDVYDVRQGAWMVAMRPLRATNLACVSCHATGLANKIQDAEHRSAIGDALGVAMYVYRTSATR